MIKHPRSYEVSIWTLQDSFITVLRSTDLENKDTIQNPQLVIKDDGENTLSLTIPMYITRAGQSVENPIWYNTRNGVISASMRKLKVIFNKKSADEEVFEFIITKVTEKHEGKKKTCEIECEGLAFHELGKQGYKIVLSPEVYYAEYEEWQEKFSKGTATAAQEPINNINYWVDKVLKNSNWSYSICMDWSFVDGIVDPQNDYINMTATQRAALNQTRESKGLRRRDKVYKEPYVSAWSYNESQNILQPTQYIEAEEKYVLVESKESNRYNLIQTIAEAFQVFTKFIYKYDDNYHIIGREVIFYNNFISEADGMIDFTYAYNTQELQREMDGTDLITRMYVKPLNDSGVITGAVTIADTSANPSLEDYLMNFDYMYMIGTITEEQYNAVKEYNVDIRKLNDELIEIEKQLTPLRTRLPYKEAEAQTATDGMRLDQEQMDNSHELLNSLTDGTGKIEVTNKAPQRFNVIHDETGNLGYYFRTNVTGIDISTLVLYAEYDSTTHIVSKPLTNNQYQVQYDEETGVNIERVYQIDPTVFNSPNTWVLYGTFKYEPALVTEKVYEIYQGRYQRDKEIKEAAETEVETLKAQIEQLEAQYAAKAEEKSLRMAAFERLMGPALREGTWQPEDEYADYVDSHSDTASMSASKIINKNTTSLLDFGWDNELFDEEQLNYYYEGAEMTKVYYPCINLTSLTTFLGKLTNKTYRETFCFEYKDVRYADASNPRVLKHLSVGTTTGCQLVFLKPKSSNTIIPALMILGAESMGAYTPDNSSQSISVLEQLKVDAKLGIMQQASTTSNYKFVSTCAVPASAWITENQLKNYEVVYPRFQINSTQLIESDTMNMVYQGTTPLEENSDYYMLYRDDKYYVTIKPNIIFQRGSSWASGTYRLNYSISTAALAIYLDSIQIMKENSQPKVSYEITPLAINTDFMHNAYARIGQLARINDEELKFKNVRGYVSEVDLDLDQPWQDTYVIKNYKTKFEDLFSTIVAETEAMKKNSTLMGLAANIFTESGNLNQDLFDEGIAGSENVIQGMISGNALVVANELAAAAASNKALLANSTALKVMNGDFGLAFPASQVIENITLNRDVGLLIEGYSDSDSTHKNFFRVTNGAMGFFEGTPDQITRALLYFQDGDLALSGNIYAENGWFGDEDNGWIISKGGSSIVTHKEGESGQIETKATTVQTYNNTALTDANIQQSTHKTTVTTVSPSNYGALLYSANGKIIFGAGDSTNGPVVGFYRTTFGKDPILIFENGNLTISGRLTAASLYETSDGQWGSMADYYAKEPEIRAFLAQRFTEAGQLLVAAQKSSTEVEQLVKDQTDILYGFYTQAKNSLVPKVYTGNTTPTTWKTGDVWKKTNGDIYVATAPSYSNGSDSTVAGWTRTYNGAIAAITGAALGVDSVKGEINITAQNKIVVATGGSLDLSGEDVVITGNKSLKLGSNKIEIGSTNEGSSSGAGYISLVYTDTNKNTITRGMLSNTGIDLLTGAGITIGTANEATANLLRMNEKGILLSSLVGITLFSTSLPSSSNSTAGAALSIQHNKILMGVTGNSSTNSIRITDTEILFGATSVITGSSPTTIGGTASGVQINKSGIKMAVGTSNSNTYFTMDSDGLILSAQGSKNTTGSYVKITKTGIELAGSTSDKSKATLQVYMPNFTVTSSGDVSITGNLTATSGAIGGWVVDSNSIYYGTKGNSTNNNDVTLMSSSVFTRAINGTNRSNLKFAIGGKFGVAQDGTLYASNAQISGDITANSFSLEGHSITYDDISEATGSTIKSTEIKYALSSSSVTTPSSSDWKDSIAALGTITPGYYIWTRTITTYSTGESVTSYSIARQGENGTSSLIASRTIKYGLSSSSTTEPTTWKTSIAALGTLTPGYYLWTRTTIIYSTGEQIQTDSIARQGENGAAGEKGDKGDQGKYVTEIVALYYLNSSTTAPDKPTSNITSTSTGKGVWTRAIPNWVNNYYYFRCEQYKWSDNTYTWSNPYIDYGMTAANSTATSASTAAASAVLAASDANGGSFRDTGLYSNYSWNSSTYQTALISSGSAPHGLLIGANRDLTIVNSAANGAAMVMDNSGIALHGAAINLTTANATNTNVIALTPTSGIKLASTLGISLASGSISMAGGDISLNSSGNLLMDGGEITLTSSPYSLTLNKDGLMMLNNNDTLLSINKDSVDFGSLTLSGKLDAPGHRPWAQDDCYTVTINSYAKFLSEKQKLNTNSYGTVIWTLSSVSELMKTTVQTFSNLQVRTFIIRGDGTGFCPPLKFVHCNTNIVITKMSFKATSSTPAVEISHGGTCSLINCWVYVAKYAIQATYGSVISWYRNPVNSWIVPEGDTLYTALAALGGMAFLEGEVPKITNSYGYFIDVENAGDEGAYRIINSITQKTGGSGSVPADSTVTVTDYTYGDSNNIMTVAKYRTVKKTGATSWDVTPSNLGIYAGREQSTVYRCAIRISKPSISYNTVTLTIPIAGGGISDTTRTLRVMACTSTWNSGNMSVSSSNAVQFTTTANNVVTIDITSIYNSIESNGFIAIVSGSSTNGEDADVVSGSAYSANASKIDCSGLILSFT